VIILSRARQPQKQPVKELDRAWWKRENIKIKKAAEIAKEALEANRYSITHLECKSNRYASVRANKSVPDPKGFLFPDYHKYRSAIKITGKDLGHQYEVSSYRKIEEFLDFSPLSFFRRYHRDENQEQKILDDIEQRYNPPAMIILFSSETATETTP